MEFFKTAIRRRSFLNGLVYVLLNIALAVLVLLFVRVTDSPFLALLLTIISKWRVLAVRPRYWLTNIAANLVDFVVGLSYVVFLYAIPDVEPQRLILQLSFMVLYIAWLLWLKPRSEKKYVVLQAGVALFCGTIALFSISFDWPISAIVLAMWLIGYAVTRHIITQYDDRHTQQISVIMAFIFAEIGWLFGHWVVAYQLPGLTDVQLPQVSIIVVLIGFLAYRTYDLYARKHKIITKELLLPLLFSLVIVAILVLFFSAADYSAA